MRRLIIVSLVLSISISVNGQTKSINFSEYLKPKTDTLVYNCIYDSFHADGLKETIKLIYKKMLIGSDTAYYISNAKDEGGTGAQLASFIGSAMIFKKDS